VVGTEFAVGGAAVVTSVRPDRMVGRPGSARVVANVTVGVRITLAVMAASMAWMFVAIQTTQMATPMLPTMPMH
jgi:hypothetical protein